MLVNNFNLASRRELKLANQFYAGKLLRYLVKIAPNPSMRLRNLERWVWLVACIWRRLPIGIRICWGRWDGVNGWQYNRVREGSLPWSGRHYWTLCTASTVSIRLRNHEDTDEHLLLERCRTLWRYRITCSDDWRSRPLWLGKQRVNGGTLQRNATSVHLPWTASHSFRSSPSGNTTANRKFPEP